jgi:hypothetical protein
MKLVALLSKEMDAYVMYCCVLELRVKSRDAMPAFLILLQK